MKTFNDLKFKVHSTGIGGTHARMDFKNGYGVSVVCGSMFYSNGLDTYELAVFKDGDICYDTEITDDVVGYNDKDMVTKIMKQIQRLKEK